MRSTVRQPNLSAFNIARLQSAIILFVQYKDTIMQYKKTWSLKRH